MSECIGIVGQIFGHSFEEFLIHSKPIGPFEAKGLSEEISKLTNEKEFMIICKRCGRLAGEYHD